MSLQINSEKKQPDTLPPTSNESASSSETTEKLLSLDSLELSLNPQPTEPKILCSKRVTQGSLIEEKSLENESADLDDVKFLQIEKACRTIVLPRSIQEFATLLTIKNLGHFFGDAVLKKKHSKNKEELEGQLVSLSLEFIISLILLCRNDPLIDQETQNIDDLVSLLKEALAYSRLLEKCATEPDFQLRFLPLIHRMVKDKIHLLGEGEKLLLPAGWKNTWSSTSHAMLLEISRNKDHTLSLKVLNTGAGIQMHPMKGHAFKQLVDPAYCFDHVEEDQVLKTGLIEALFDLNTVSPKDRDYTEEDIYHLFFRRFGQAPSRDYQSGQMCCVTAQRSGTCSMRSILAYAHIVLGTSCYKRLKIVMDTFVLEAISQSSSIAQSELDPEYIFILGHTVRRCAWNMLKNLENNDQDEELTRFIESSTEKIEDVETIHHKLQQAIDEAAAPISPQDPNLQNSYLDEVIAASSEAAAQMPQLNIPSETICPTLQPTPIFSIDFSQLSKGQEWISAINNLIALFDLKDPTDKTQQVAAYVTTQAIATLVLPNIGIFHSEIDTAHVIGTLSLDEKKLLASRLKELSRKYATAFFLQRKEQTNNPYLAKKLKKETELLEHYICIYTMYALFWRLSLHLEREEVGAKAMLQEYSVDISHLESIRKSPYLPSYNSHGSLKLATLTSFFSGSSIMSNEPLPPLFNINQWFDPSANNLKFPLESDFSDAPLFNRIYSELPEKSWEAVDSKWEELKNRPVLKQWRMAHLFAHPDRWSAFMDENTVISVQYYQELREMALICRLFKWMPHEKTPLQFLSPEWTDAYECIRMPLGYRKKNFNPPAFPRSIDDMRSYPYGTEDAQSDEFTNYFVLHNYHFVLDPDSQWEVGKNLYSHYPLIADSFKRSKSQNAYILSAPKASKHFYEIAESEKFAIDRLLAFYRENLEFLKNGEDQAFFQLILYHVLEGLVHLDSARHSQIEALRFERAPPSPSGKGDEEDRFGKVTASPNSPNLTERGIFKQDFFQAQKASPLIRQQLFNLIDRGLTEFELQRKMNPSSDEILKTLIFLYGVKITACHYWHISDEHMLIQQQIEQLLKCCSQGSISPARKALQANLHHLWICALTPSGWKDPHNCQKNLIHLAEAKRLEHSCRRYQEAQKAFDPTLESLTIRIVYSHLGELISLLGNAKSLEKTGKEILQIYEEVVDELEYKEGIFPRIILMSSPKLDLIESEPSMRRVYYEINILNGTVLRDGVSLTKPLLHLPQEINEYFPPSDPSLQVFQLTGDQHGLLEVRCSGKKFIFTLSDRTKKWFNKETDLSGFDDIIREPAREEIEESAEKEMMISTSSRPALSWDRSGQLFSLASCGPPLEKLKGIPLAKKPENYRYWINQNRSADLCAVIEDQETGEEEVLIYREGYARRKGKEGRWRFVLADTIVEFSSLISILPKEKIAVWEPVDHLGASEAQCFDLIDRQGSFLQLEKREGDERWHLVNIPGYWLSKQQKVKAIRSYFPYTVVENKSGEKKVILPVRPSKKDCPIKHDLEVINLDSEENFDALTQKQMLLLAFYFIGSKQYERAAELLKAVDGTAVYSPQELQILAWIFLHPETQDNHDPQMVALSLKAAYLVESNFQQFPENYLVTDQPSDKEDSSFHEIKCINDLHSSSSLWVEFWKARVSWRTRNRPENIDQLIAKRLSRYYEISQHCYGDFNLNSFLLDPSNEIEWLKKIHSLSPHDHLLQRLNYLIAEKQQDDELLKEALSYFLSSSRLPTFPKIIPDKLKAQTNMYLWLRYYWWEPKVVSPQEIDSALLHMNRVRPGKDLIDRFDALYALTKIGTDNQKRDLLTLLEDMQYDDTDGNQLARAILLSQLPPYCVSQDNTSAKIAQLLDAISAACLADPKDGKWNSRELQGELSQWVIYWHSIVFREIPGAGWTPDGNQKKSNFSDQVTLNSPQLPQDLVPKMSYGGAAPIDPQEQIDKPDQVLESSYFQVANPQDGAVASIEYPALPNHMQQTPYFSTRAQALRDDIAKGSSLNTGKSCYVLKDHVGIPQLKALRSELTQNVDQNNKELRSLRSQIKQLIHKVSDPTGQRSLLSRLSRLSKKEIPPTRKECLALFVQADLALYQKRLPFLSEKDCHQLHEILGNYLEIATKVQHVQRCAGKLDKVLKKMTKGQDASAAVHLLALEMHKTREYDPSSHPELMLFEYYAGFSLRKEQCENFITMIKKAPNGQFVSLLLQLIMSGGKTSVLGSLLALKKADGYHLSLLLMPRSLLETNGISTKKQNASFFGQKGHVLEFNRSKHYFNESYLNRLHAKLITIITNRDYLILTPETLLSLQNQYIEAREKIYHLGQNGASDEEIALWQTPAEKLKAILLLILERGAATFDEVDAQFSARKELNYPGSKTSSLDHPSIELAGSLYEIACTDPEIKALGLDLHKNTQARVLPQAIDQIKLRLSDKIVQAISTSPLLCEQLGLTFPCPLSVIKDLLFYFSHQDNPAPEWLLDLTNSPLREDQLAAERLVLVRQQILKWLPSCWKFGANEHFSRSKLHSDYLAAKPNLCADTPNESSEIARPWELVNKTFQLYVANGVDLNQTKEIIEDLQKLALIQNRYLQPLEGESSDQMIQRTEASSTFQEMVCGFQEAYTLLGVDTCDPHTLRKMQTLLNSGSSSALKLIIRYLVNHVIPKLEFHTEQIYNYPISLGSAVSSEQGYSGTIENLYTFSDRFTQAPKETVVWDEGANGRVVDVLCRRNRMTHVISSELNMPEHMLTFLQQSQSIEEKNQYKAFIDIGAHFKGRSNRKNAESFLRYFSDLEGSCIEGVLYYDDTKNALACLKKREKKPLIIGSTDGKTIYALTSLKPNQLFTFYDQFHTVGANIIQTPEAKAYYTIGDQTILRDLLQGAMRMRGLLDAEQTIEGVIPDNLIPLISLRTEQQIDQIPSIEQILLFSEVTGLVKDQEENVKTFDIKCNNAIRKHLLSLLYHSDVQREKDLYSAVRNFFIRITKEELVKLYGNPTQQMKQADYISLQLTTYKTALNTIEHLLPPKVMTALLSELDQIAKVASGYLPPFMNSLLETENTTVEKISEAEKQVEKSTELDLETQQENQLNLASQEAKEQEWDFTSFPIVMEQLLSFKAPSFLEKKTVRLQQVIPLLSDFNPHLPDFSHCVSPEILVSRNFIETVSHQVNLFDKFKKTPWEALVFYDEEEKKNYLLFLSSKEAEHFSAFINSYQSLPLELLNADAERVLLGKSLASGSAELANIGHLQIQMLFLSGRLTNLESQRWEKELLAYLSTDKRSKREFFESLILDRNKLQRYREGPLGKLLGCSN